MLSKSFIMFSTKIKRKLSHQSKYLYFKITIYIKVKLILKKPIYNKYNITNINLTVIMHIGILKITSYMLRAHGLISLSPWMIMLLYHINKNTYIMNVHHIKT
jgi:hypothetical protein